MSFIILGPQGCGKGTQAELVAQKFKLEHFDAGNALRRVAKQDTPLGREVYAIQNVTKTLVPARILREVLHIRLASLPREQEVVFDGVPRKMEQAQYFEEALLEFGRKIEKVFFINIDEEESVRRISKRWTCKECKQGLVMGQEIATSTDRCPHCNGEIMQRGDDTPEGIRKRLKIFLEETMPVIEFYRERGLLVEIDGAQAVEKVFADIVDKMPEL